MTVERQGERAKQSFKASQYLLQNPSNHVRDVGNCLQTPGISCRALNVKAPNTVDTETALLRGRQSEAVVIAPTFASSPLVPAASTTTPELSFVNALGNSTRMPKSCYFEQPIPSRLEPLHTPVQSHYVNEDTKALFGMDTRNTSKYFF
jgi:hypothetical protein